MTEDEVKKIDQQIVDILTKHTNNAALAANILINCAANISYQLNISKADFERLCKENCDSVYADDDGPFLM